MLRPFRILVLGCLAALALAACATEEPVKTVDRDVPPRDPAEYWRIVTPYSVTSTSDCIGVPISPVCAMETLIAAFERDDNDLYELATGAPPTVPFGKGPKISFVRYRIVEAVRLTDQNISDWSGKYYERWGLEQVEWYPGDVVVQVLRLMGDIRIPPSIRELCPWSIYYVTREDERGYWFVVDWAATHREYDSDDFPYGECLI